MMITIFIIIFPEQSLHASVHGLHTWWEVVFPSLLPFFIAAELLTSFGVVQFFGVLFEPIMRPIFNVPGVGSFAWMLGMVSGFPSGAKITVLLREKQELSRIEAERLVSFSNASNPLFIFGAIAVGFFHHVQLGIIIASCHYISNIIVGLLMRFHGQNKEKKQMNKQKYKLGLFKKAFFRMHLTRLNEKRTVGEIIGDAVLSSIQTLLMIGGFIILFSVFTTLLSVVHITELIQTMFSPLLNIFRIPSEIIGPFITGVFEITIGAEAIAQTSLPIVWQLALVSFILGFNGFSIQAQVASLIATTDIRFSPYFFARILHAVTASFLTIMSYHFYFKKKLTVTETTIAISKQSTFFQVTEKITSLGPMITILSLCLASLLLLRKIYREKI